tara:strand:+ start:411 stop:599 length:189 start_codon:yes stop_codon:yes gene_type:complete
MYLNRKPKKIASIRKNVPVLTNVESKKLTKQNFIKTKKMNKYNIFVTKLVLLIKNKTKGKNK